MRFRSCVAVLVKGAPFTAHCALLQNLKGALDPQLLP
jgi:hypothetical protein